MNADEIYMQHARMLVKISPVDMAFKKSMGAAARICWC